MICKVNGDLTGRLVQHDDYYEMQEFFLGFSKRTQNCDLRNTPLFPLAKQLTRRQIQIFWVKQREQVSNFSYVFLSQGFEEILWYYYYQADPEQAHTQTSILPVQPQQHWISALQPDMMAPQLQMTPRYALQTISLMCLFTPDNHSIIRLPQID